MKPQDSRNAPADVRAGDDVAQNQSECGMETSSLGRHREGSSSASENVEAVVSETYGVKTEVNDVQRKCVEEETLRRH